MNWKITTLAIIFSLFATVNTFGKEVVNKPVKPLAQSGKVLVAYFSYTGNTRFAAQEISKLTGGDLFEIKPVKAYPTDQHECAEQVRKELRDKHKPALTGKVDQFEKYTIIFVGSPTWWKTIAPPVAAFLTAYDFTGKVIVPFSTHGGSGMRHAEKDIKALSPKANVLKNGAFYGSGIERAQNDIKEWVMQSVTLQK